jgi:thiamine-monophosphate kinase
MPGEFELIDWIKTQQHPTDLVRLPAGDDLAILEWKPKDLLLVGADQVLDGRHFDSTRHSPREIGRKVMNRNLSDCAAMACLPAAAVLTVALPRTASISYAKELYLGVKDAADPWYCSIVGGDTATWDGRLVASVTILGRSAGIEPLTRNGAVPGDGIYVTGPLGGSILGRHMTFAPQIALARTLAKYRPTGMPCIKAMIDLSDGLSRDLRHLLAANDDHPELGADLEAALIPIHPDATLLSQSDGQTPLHHALHDGEDYELLFTCPVRPPAGNRIGTVTDHPGILLDGQPLATEGWEHPLLP